MHIFPKETRIIPFFCLSSRFFLFLIVLVSLPCHRCPTLAGPQTARPAQATRSRAAAASPSSCTPPRPHQKISVLGFSRQYTPSTPRRRRPWCTSWESRCRSRGLRRQFRPEWFVHRLPQSVVPRRRLCRLH